MYEYHYVALKVEGTFNAYLEGHRSVIRDCAQEGWRYVGWVPTRTNAAGVVCELDLIFERALF